MAESEKATPRPWYQGKGALVDGCVYGGGEDQGNYLVAVCAAEGTAPDKASSNAALIAEAVNNYERLRRIEALAVVLARETRAGFSTTGISEHHSTAPISMRAWRLAGELLAQTNNMY